jgi:DNA gyrase subunit A
MTKLAEYMLADIEKETIDFRDNFDATKQEPSVMPTRIPNLLMN